MSAIPIKHFFIAYHANCNDGFGSYWAAQHMLRKLYPDCTINAQSMNYGDRIAPELLAPGIDSSMHELFVLDFSFSPEILIEYTREFEAVFWVDHHKSAIAAWYNYLDAHVNIKYISNLDIAFSENNEHSGCVLTWNQLASLQANPLPYFLLLIEDNDLWKFSFYQTKAFKAGLSTIPMEIESWDRLLDRDFLNSLTEKGEAILAYKNSLINQIIKTGCMPIKIDGIHGLCCNAPRELRDEIGDILVERCGSFGATWHENKDGNTQFSLRSKSTSPVDVSKLAEPFGGGGHRNAAGFILKYIGVTPGNIVLWSDMKDQLKNEWKSYDNQQFTDTKLGNGQEDFEVGG